MICWETVKCGTAKVQGPMALCSSAQPLNAYWSKALPAMNDSADWVLVKASLDGDRNAFAELVERYWPAVCRIVFRTLGNTADGEDAVQEVFIRALISLSKYDRQYPFAPWILKIASNYCIDQIRRRKAPKYKLWSDLSESEERKALWRPAETNSTRKYRKFVHRPMRGSPQFLTMNRERNSSRYS